MWFHIHFLLGRFDLEPFFVLSKAGGLEILTFNFNCCCQKKAQVYLN